MWAECLLYLRFLMAIHGNLWYNSTRGIMQYPLTALIAEQSGYKQFLAQFAVDGTAQALLLPTKLLDGSGQALPSNCMLMLQCTQNFRYDLGDTNGAVDTSTNIRLQYYGQTINFAVGDTITGGTSGKTGVIVSDTDNGDHGYLVLSSPSGTFTIGETITGGWKRLAYNTQTGNFTVGQVITGGTSGSTATIQFDIDGGTTGTLVISGASGPFTVGETITDPIVGSAKAGATTVDGSALAGNAATTYNPGILALANAQEKVRRAVNFNNPMTYLLVKSAAPGTLNVFYVSVKTDITQPGDLSIY
jgi:hypothetical protein